MKKYCSRAIDICANFLRKQINFIWDMSEVLPMLILWKHSVLLYATNSVKIQFYKEIIKEEKKMSSLIIVVSTLVNYFTSDYIQKIEKYIVDTP